jgi:hypothetical protein
VKNTREIAEALDTRLELKKREIFLEEDIEKAGLVLAALEFMFLDFTRARIRSTEARIDRLKVDRRAILRKIRGIEGRLGRSGFSIGPTDP